MDVNIPAPQLFNNLPGTYLKFGYNLPSVFHTIAISIKTFQSRGMVESDYTQCMIGCASDDCVGMSQTNFHGYNKCMNKGNILYSLCLIILC